jgi:hypothetical protein
MTDENNEQQQDKDITGPSEETKDATTPPGNPEVDEEALEEGQDRLEQAGGGH